MCEMVGLPVAGGAHQWQHRGGAGFHRISTGLQAHPDDARHHVNREENFAEGIWRGAHPHQWQTGELLHHSACKADATDWNFSSGQLPRSGRAMLAGQGRVSCLHGTPLCVLFGLAGQPSWMTLIRQMSAKLVCCSVTTGRSCRDCTAASFSYQALTCVLSSTPY